MDFDSSVERSLAAGHIFELFKIAAEFGLANSLFKKIFASPLIEFKPMDLIETDCLAVSQMADVDQLAAGGAQHGVLIGAAHLGNHHRR